MLQIGSGYSSAHRCPVPVLTSERVSAHDPSILLAPSLDANLAVLPLILVDEECRHLRRILLPITPLETDPEAGIEFVALLESATNYRRLRQTLSSLNSAPEDKIHTGGLPSQYLYMRFELDRSSF